MNIPDKAMYAAFQAATGGAELHLDDRMYWEQAAKDMLEAAAPFIAAQALRDYADVVADGRVSFRDSEARGLRERAKWLEAGA